MKSNQFIYFLILTFFFVGCKRVAETLPAGQSYFPLELGKYITYQVTEYEHDAFTETTDTSLYWNKEELEEIVFDNTGAQVYKLAVSESYDSAKTWNFLYYSIVQLDDYAAQRTENNIRRIVLSFPLKERKNWDVNDLNSLDFKKARLLNIDSSFTTVLGHQFNKTLIVDLGDEEDPFFKNLEKEVYADGIGLIEQEFVDIETQPGKYKQGNEYIKTLYETNW